MLLLVDRIEVAPLSMKANSRKRDSARHAEDPQNREESINQVSESDWR
jgi:hypothetical protein